jgi:hypothetical protein
MTNTLHRYGNAESFKDDYIIFAIPSKGKNDEGCIPKLKEFLKICLRHNPVNMGNGQRGVLAPQKNLGPRAHWKRTKQTDFSAVIDGVVKPGTVSAVFSNESDARECLKEIIEADFGISINISTSVENAKATAHKCGISRHSVEYALSVTDPHDHLPNSQILSLSTMCGHGMVSFNLARKMLDMVREGRRTPEQAVETLTRFCPCGVYNPERAKRLLLEASKEQR